MDTSTQTSDTDSSKTSHMLLVVQERNVEQHIVVTTADEYLAAQGEDAVPLTTLCNMIPQDTVRAGSDFERKFWAVNWKIRDAMKPKLSGKQTAEAIARMTNEDDTRDAWRALVLDQTSCDRCRRVYLRMYPNAGVAADPKPAGEPFEQGKPHPITKRKRKEASTENVETIADDDIAF